MKRICVKRDPIPQNFPPAGGYSSARPGAARRKAARSADFWIIRISLITLILRFYLARGFSYPRNAEAAVRCSLPQNNLRGCLLPPKQKYFKIFKTQISGFTPQHAFFCSRPECWSARRKSAAPPREQWPQYPHVGTL